MSAAEAPDGPVGDEADRRSLAQAALESAAFGLFLITLALAPFPLGSNRPWSWSLLSLLIATCWLLWWLSVWPRPEAAKTLARGLAGPILLGLLALSWGVIQIVPVVPQAWVHPAWKIAGAALGTHLNGVISIAPWRTATELMKLGTYGMAAWLARAFGSRTRPARLLLSVIILVGTLYAVYGFALALTGQSQFEFFYGMRAVRDVRDLAGPFVNHNSYATYAGLIALCAGARLIGGGWTLAGWGRGILSIVSNSLQYALSGGAVWLAAAILTISTVIATSSRGGNFATFSAMIVLLGISLLLAERQARGAAATGAALIALAGIAFLFAVNGQVIASHLDDMMAAGLNQNLRPVLWKAALRMIHDAPFLGLGLGTYQVTYPAYSVVTVPFVMDKAHNDYLELAAGLGLPAAILWWSALLWLIAICVRGIFVRRRNCIYPMLAVGAGILIGVHATLDFSLQIPAVAITFAAILGLGVAQSFPTPTSSSGSRESGASR